MKWLIVVVELLTANTGKPNVSVVSGPYSSWDECETAMVRTLNSGESVSKNQSGAMIKTIPDRPHIGAHQFQQCLPYNSNW